MAGRWLNKSLLCLTNLETRHDPHLNSGGPPKVASPNERSARISGARPRSRMSAIVFTNGAGKVEQLNNIVRRGLHPALLAAGVTTDTCEVDEAGQPILKTKYTGFPCALALLRVLDDQQEGGHLLGLSPKAVQERMGHSSIVITLSVYAYLFPQSDDAADLAADEMALLG